MKKQEDSPYGHRVSSRRRTPTKVHLLCCRRHDIQNSAAEKSAKHLSRSRFLADYRISAKAGRRNNTGSKTTDHQKRLRLTPDVTPASYTNYNIRLKIGCRFYRLELGFNRSTMPDRKPFAFGFTTGRKNEVSSELSDGSSSSNFKLRFSNGSSSISTGSVSSKSL